MFYSFSGKRWGLFATDNMSPVRLQAGRAAQFSRGVEKIGRHTKTVSRLREAIVLTGQSGNYLHAS